MSRDRSVRQYRYAYMQTSDTCTCCAEDQSRRIAAALAWAGKPSWLLIARIVGVIRRRAVASARATAVRLRNASAVMPLETWANPPVGRLAGQPMTKLPAQNNVCWPTRISPALSRRSTSSASTDGVDGDLEVLGCPAVGDLGGLGRDRRRSRSRR